MPFSQALRQTRGLGQCLHHRREEATGTLHTARALGLGTVGDCLRSFPGTPPQPTTLPHLGGRRHLTARFSMGLFLRVPGMAPGGKPVCPLDRWPRRCCPLGTRGTGQASLLPRLLPQRGARTPSLSSPHVDLADRLPSLRTGSGDTCLATGLMFVHSRLSCFPSVSQPQGQRLLLFPGGIVLRLPHT